MLPVARALLQNMRPGGLSGQVPLDRERIVLGVWRHRVHCTVENDSRAAATRTR